MKILITGIAGFIGFHVAKKLIEAGNEVIGLDNLNKYYDINLKINRLIELGINKNELHSNEKILYVSNINPIKFYKIELENQEAVLDLFTAENIEIVCHMAAQPGIRYGLENPHAYIQSNIVGFLNILEACRRHNVNHLVYASSSSVYGLNTLMPFSTSNNVDHPVSLYAATKKSNELMAHSYSHLFSLPTTGLRFFTVYGPWGRPDMAPFIFTDSIIKNKTINIFNNGLLERDFTYIDDIVNGVLAIIFHPPKGNENWSGNAPDPSSSMAPYKIYNVGNNAPVVLIDFIEELENIIGIKAKKNFLPMQPGDVTATYADLTDFTAQTGFRPKTDLTTGLNEYVIWFRNYYKI